MQKLYCRRDDACVSPNEALCVFTHAYGFNNPKELENGVWELGRIRGCTLYYADNPAALRPFLESNRRAIFTFQGVASLDLPAKLATRGRSIAQLLKSEPGMAQPVPDLDTLDAIAPRQLAGLDRSHIEGGLCTRIYAWTLLMVWWYGKLRAHEERPRRPDLKTIAFWFELKAPLSVRLAHPSPRTLKRDLRELRHPHSGSVAELLGGEFILLWNGCTDIRFVENGSRERLHTVVDRLAKLLPGHDPDNMPQTNAYGRPVYQPL